MLISTTIPQTQTIPPRAVVQAIYATATNPENLIPQRVKVENVYKINGRKVAHVRGLNPGANRFAIRAEFLRSVSYFVSLEAH